jgi:hypothetical protein
MNYIFFDNLKRAETSIVLIVFHGVLYDVRAYTVTVFTVAQRESGTRQKLYVGQCITKIFIQ